jgi:uncharacterized membrane protein YkoI
MRRCILISAVILALAGSGGPSALAQGHDRAREAVRSGDIRPLGDILRSVRGAVAGEVLDVRLVDRGPPSNWRYEVRVQTPEGHVVAVLVDAQTAAVTGTRGRNGGGRRR